MRYIECIHYTKFKQYFMLWIHSVCNKSLTTCMGITDLQNKYIKALLWEQAILVLKNGHEI